MKQTLETLVKPETVARYAGELGIGRVCMAYGGMDAGKFKDLWELAFGDQPIPDGIMPLETAAALPGEGENPKDLPTARELAKLAYWVFCGEPEAVSKDEIWEACNGQSAWTEAIAAVIERVKEESPAVPSGPPGDPVYRRVREKVLFALQGDSSESAEMIRKVLNRTEDDELSTVKAQAACAEKDVVIRAHLNKERWSCGVFSNTLQQDTDGPWILADHDALQQVLSSDCGKDFIPASRLDDWKRVAEGLYASLETLHAMIWGECPSLLNEDSGGSGDTDDKARQSLAAYTALETKEAQ